MTSKIISLNLLTRFIKFYNEQPEKWINSALTDWAIEQKNEYFFPRIQLLEQKNQQLNSNRNVNVPTEQLIDENNKQIDIIKNIIKPIDDFLLALSELTYPISDVTDIHINQIKVCIENSTALRGILKQLLENI